MDKINSGEYTFYVGQRVAGQVGSQGNWYYGFIQKIKSMSQVKVRFDVGDPVHKTKTLPVASVVPVIMWKLDKAPKDFSDLETTKLPPHKTMTTSLMQFHKHLLQGMWEYANSVGFDGNLSIPAWEINSSGTTKGMYSTNKKGTAEFLKAGKGTITISKSLKSVRNTFETVVHEMVHQQNFEIDARNPDVRKSLLKNVHGDVFMKYAPTLKNKLGVNITQYADNHDVNLNIDVSGEKRKSKKQLYFAVITYPIDSRYTLRATIRFADKDDAMNFYVDIQDFSRRKDLLYRVFKFMTTPYYDSQGVKYPSAFEILYGFEYNKELKAYGTSVSFYTTEKSGLSKLVKPVKNPYSRYIELPDVVALTEQNFKSFQPKMIADISYNTVTKYWEEE